MTMNNTVISPQGRTILDRLRGSGIPYAAKAAEHFEEFVRVCFTEDGTPFESELQYYIRFSDDTHDDGYGIQYNRHADLTLDYSEDPTDYRDADLSTLGRWDDEKLSDLLTPEVFAAVESWCRARRPDAGA